MRKIAAYAMLGVMLLFAGCGSGEGNGTPTGTPQNLTPTTEPVATNTPTPLPTPEPTATEAPKATEAPQETKAPQETLVSEPTEEAQSTETKLVLGEYRGMVLNDVTEEELADQLIAELYEFAEYVATDRPAELGDITNINYVGKLDGVPFEGGTDDTEEGTDLELGSGSFIDGFEEGLVGAVAGEVRDLELTFPEDYHSADMAGKTVIFTVTVNEVLELVLPELTDKFVSENIAEGMTAEEFGTVVYEELRWEVLTGQITDQLMSSSVLEVFPEEELKAEAEEIINMYMTYVQYYASILGADEATMLQFFGFEDMAALEEYAYSYAMYMIKSSLVMSAVAVREGITVTEEEYAIRAMEYALANGYTDIASFEADYGAEEVEEAILIDLVLEFIISNAIIVEEN